MKQRLWSRVVGAAAVGGLVVAGCDGFTGSAGDKPEGTRLIEGRLLIPVEEDIVGRQVNGLQMAALHLLGDGNEGIVPSVSAVFDPAGQRGEAAFVINAPGDVDTVLVLQVPSGSQRGVGDFVGLYQYENGETLVPAGEDDLDLGALTITKGAREPADTVLTGSAGTSPAAQTDSDGDGLTNNVDDDDDDDGVLDNADDDVAGDGVVDGLQRLNTLTDQDGDGVPDALQG